MIFKTHSSCKVWANQIYSFVTIYLHKKSKIKKKLPR